jgi:glycosyltransferase involved in cell wall biosynthesis
VNPPAASLRKRILFVHDDNPKDPLSSFIRSDLDGLRQWYAVEELSLFPFRRGHMTALLRPAVWSAVHRSDAVFVWFGWNAAVVLMAWLLRKPAVVVAGGGDVVSVPEIGYGVARDSLFFRLITLGYRIARKTLLFSEASLLEYLRRPGVRPENAEMLYLGVDSMWFRPGARPKSRAALTVSYVSESALTRKGLLTFVEAARLASDVEFRIAGLVQESGAVQRLVSGAPPNVKFLGYLEDPALLSEFQAARVYAQLSHHEGFGLSLAEAMACECIPVVTARGSIPEVAGDTGHFVPVDDPAAAATAIRRAVWEDDAGKGRAARARIVERFPPAQREAGLRATMQEVVG